MYPQTARSLDAWVMLSYIAGRTTRIRLGTCVTPIPLRPPGMLAKMVATLDCASGGRVSLGVGAGWHRPEFEAFSTWDDGPTRVSKVSEGIELISRLWTEDSVDFEGRFYHAKNASIEPKPVQKPFPQLWFGGVGNKMLSLAAKYGNAWIPTTKMLSNYDYAERVSRLRSALEKRGRSGFTFAYNLFTPLLAVKEYDDSIESFRRMGCECYVINWSYDKEECVSRLRWFERDVMRTWL
jgi:alkanesulfonate monooxygenase SsuD/methylene tetrahydromethanopterin reductase-like flavin-dependent oxidoreductase (luciferase family)